MVEVHNVTNDTRRPAAPCGPGHHACPCTLARLELFEELREGAAWLVEGAMDRGAVSLDALAALERSLDALERFEAA